MSVSARKPQTNMNFIWFIHKNTGLKRSPLSSARCKATKDPPSGDPDPEIVTKTQQSFTLSSP